MGLDTFIHAGQGSGTAAGGAIRFQYAPAAGASPNPLVTALQIGTTGHLAAGDSATGDPARMIKWGTSYNTPAFKATGGSNPELQIRRGDDSGAAALFYRLSVAPTNLPPASPINESESNRIFTNQGAIGALTFTLPPSYSNVGFHCHFAVVAGYPVNIAASGSDTIRIGTQATTTGGSITASEVGKWVALSREGTWN